MDAKQFGEMMAKTPVLVKTAAAQDFGAMLAKMAVEFGQDRRKPQQLTTPRIGGFGGSRAGAQPSKVPGAGAAAQQGNATTSPVDGPALARQAAQSGYGPTSTPTSYQRRPRNAATRPQPNAALNAQLNQQRATAAAKQRQPRQRTSYQRRKPTPRPNAALNNQLDAQRAAAYGKIGRKPAAPRPKPNTPQPNAALNQQLEAKRRAAWGGGGTNRTGRTPAAGADTGASTQGWLGGVGRFLGMGGGGGGSTPPAPAAPAATPTPAAGPPTTPGAGSTPGVTVQDTNEIPATRGGMRGLGDAIFGRSQPAATPPPAQPAATPTQTPPPATPAGTTTTTRRQGHLRPDQIPKLDMQGGDPSLTSSQQLMQARIRRMRQMAKKVPQVQ